MTIKKLVFLISAVFVSISSFVFAQNTLFLFNVQEYTAGNVSNLPVYSVLSGSEPAKGTCFYDTNYNMSVCKIQDANDPAVAATGGVVRPVYARWRVDNSNGTLYYLVKEGSTGGSNGQMIIFNSLDDSVYKIVTEINGLEDYEFRWDYSGSKPRSLYYVDGCQFREYNAITGQTSLVRNFSSDFANCNRIMNDVEGDSSADSRYWVWMVTGPYTGSTFPINAIFTYDKTTDTILGTLDYAKYQSLGGKQSSLPRPNMVDMSLSGNKVVLLNSRAWDDRSYTPSSKLYLDIGGNFDGPHAWNKDFTSPIKVCIDEAHSGWGYNKNGNEVFVCQDNRRDYITYTNIVTGEKHDVIYHGDLGWNNGFHFGRFYNTAIKGWINMTTYSSSNTKWGDNEIIMLELKDISEHPRVWRIADTHNNYPGASAYPREAYSPISADGKTIYWGADWPGGNGTVDAYKVTLPDNWWLLIDGITTYHPADTNQNGKIEMRELIAFIGKWKANQATLADVLDIMGRWLRGE